jgi:hypothetical protein
LAIVFRLPTRVFKVPALALTEGVTRRLVGRRPGQNQDGWNQDITVEAEYGRDEAV